MTSSFVLVIVLFICFIFSCLSSYKGFKSLFGPKLSIKNGNNFSDILVFFGSLFVSIVLFVLVVGFSLVMLTGLDGLD